MFACFVDGPNSNAMNITGFTGFPEVGLAILSAPITCSATGNPAPSYQWTGPYGLTSAGPTIEISVIGSDWVYTCTASNIVGSATRSATLTVITSTSSGVSTQM